MALGFFVVGQGIYLIISGPVVDSSNLFQGDWNKLNQRFDRVEKGIINASQDRCDILGGVFPVDTNGMPVIYSTDYLVDENTSTFRRISYWPCFFLEQR